MHCKMQWPTANSSHLPGLELCRFRGGSFHRGGNDGWLDCLLLGLLRTRHSKCSQRIDPVPANSRAEESETHFWLVGCRKGNSWMTDFIQFQKHLGRRISIPDVFQELVEFKSRKLWEPAAGERHLICAYSTSQWNQILTDQKSQHIDWSHLRPRQQHSLMYSAMCYVKGLQLGQEKHSQVILSTLIRQWWADLLQLNSIFGLHDHQGQVHVFRYFL